jgi:hypothetical protein
MNEREVEQAAEEFAEGAVNADMATTLRLTTPDGLASLMEATGIHSQWFKYLSYEVLPATADGGDYLVEIRYETDIGPRRMRYRFRSIDGTWKVVAVERLA